MSVSNAVTDVVTNVVTDVVSSVVGVGAVGVGTAQAVDVGTAQAVGVGLVDTIEEVKVVEAADVSVRRNDYLEIYKALKRKGVVLGSRSISLDDSALPSRATVLHSSTSVPPLSALSVTPPVASKRRSEESDVDTDADAAIFICRACETSPATRGVRVVVKYCCSSVGVCVPCFNKWWSMIQGRSVRLKASDLIVFCTTCGITFHRQVQWVYVQPNDSRLLPNLSYFGKTVTECLEVKVDNLRECENETYKQTYLRGHSNCRGLLQSEMSRLRLLQCSSDEKRVKLEQVCTGMKRSYQTMYCNFTEQVKRLKTEKLSLEEKLLQVQATATQEKELLNMQMEEQQQRFVQQKEKFMEQQQQLTTKLTNFKSYIASQF